MNFINTALCFYCLEKNNIIKLSKTENPVTVMTSNEVFNKDKPDTFFEMVKK